MKTKRSLPAAIVVVALLGAACGGDEEPSAEETTPAAVETTVVTVPPTVTETATAAPTVEATEDDGGATGATSIQAEQIVECLSGAGMEAEAEEVSLPVYGEEMSVSVTFEFESVGATVPDAVEVLLFPDEETAAKAKTKIDENLLEGDTPTVLVGNAVLDDFGSTLTEPEAADQAETLTGCVEDATV